MPPRVSIIIPTYNRGALIRECLEAVLAQRDAPPFEVIVVNDGSTDDTARVVAGFPGVRLISQKNAGPGAARNRGVMEARGDIVVFTDDDCVPEPSWLAHLVAPFEDPEVAATKGAYLTAQQALVARFVQVEYEEKYDELRRHPDIDFIDTYSAAFRKEVFLESGGYDPAFPTASVEDQELSFRLAAAGHRMRFVPDARVWHRHVDSLSAYCRKKHKIGFWKVLVLARSPSRVKGDSHTPATLKLQVAIAGALPPLLAAGALLPGLWLGCAAAAGIFAASTLPLTARCARVSPGLAAAAPVLIACRAGALAAGLARGGLHKLRGDPRFRPRPAPSA